MRLSVDICGRPSRGTDQCSQRGPGDSTPLVHCQCHKPEISCPAKYEPLPQLSERVPVYDWPSFAVLKLIAGFFSFPRRPSDVRVQEDRIKVAMLGNTI